MRREQYDKVQRYMEKHEGASLKKACEVLDVRPGTYYSQRGNVVNSDSKRTIKRATRKPRDLVTYDVEPLIDSGAIVPSSLSPGMVLLGTPDSVARIISLLSRGGAT